MPVANCLAPALHIFAFMKEKPNPEKVVLIINTDESLSKGIALALEDLFSEILISVNPTQAVSLVKQKPFALIITEIQFRTMDGFDLLIALQAPSPETPILVCSAYTDENVKDKLKNMGITGIIEKPVCIDHLRTIIQSLITKRREK